MVVVVVGGPQDYTVISWDFLFPIPIVQSQSQSLDNITHYARNVCVKVYARYEAYIFGVYA